MAEGADHPLARTAEKSYKIEMTDFFLFNLKKEKHYCIGQFLIQNVV